MQKYYEVDFVLAMQLVCAGAYSCIIINYLIILY